MNIRKLFLIALKKEKRHKKLDLLVTLSFFLLLIFSCIMVYSASMIGNKYGMFTNFEPVSATYFLNRQILWACLSIVSYLIFSLFIPYEILKNRKIYSLGLIIVVILLFIPQFQTSINGAKSWIRFAGISFQTSALAQIFLILYMAWILNSRREYLMRPTSLQKLTNIFFVPILVMFCIFIQNDTGTMLITGIVIVILVLCSNMNFKNIMKLFKLGVVSLLILVFITLIKRAIFSSGPSYQINRFKVFWDPFYGTNDPNNQIVNSLIAFGNGGLFGRGLGNSIQKLGYLSEAHTDFILAITAEEFGFIGVLFLILLLLIVIIRVMYTGIKSDNTFDSIFAIGFASLISIQTVINIGGVTAAIPLTGVPIPFFSYGGTSLLILSTTLGIIVNMLSHVKYKKGGL